MNKTSGEGDCLCLQKQAVSGGSQLVLETKLRLGIPAQLPTAFILLLPSHYES